MPTGHTYPFTFRAAIASQYIISKRSIHDISEEFGLSPERIHNLMHNAGVKRNIAQRTGRWVLEQDGKVYEESFKILDSDSIGPRTGKNVKARVKKNLNPELPHKLYFVMSSKANTEPEKLTASEAKQQIAEILEKTDRHQLTTTSGYAKIAGVIDALATGTPTELYKPFGGHTKAESLCWANAAEDEPVFVLRGQDMSAPGTIIHWIQANVNNPLMPDAKLMEAFDTALAMRSWRERKFPD